MISSLVWTFHGLIISQMVFYENKEVFQRKVFFGTNVPTPRKIRYLETGKDYLSKQALNSSTYIPWSHKCERA